MAEPIAFPEANRTLSKPAGMTDDQCSSLHVWTDGSHCWSKWRLTWRERLGVLCRGHVWLGVRSGATQPPVCVTAIFPFDYSEVAEEEAAT